MESTLAGNHFVENRAERKQVGALVGNFPANLLGRHVAGRAHHEASIRDYLDGGGISGRVGLFGLSQLGQAEVENLRASVFRDEDVFRLQVAMNDAFVMGGRESARDLQGVIHRFPRREGAILQKRAQGFAEEQFRDDVGCALPFPDVVDREDVGMVQRGRGTSFLRKAAETVGIR